MKKIICVNCGKEYYARHNGSKYCSRACYYEIKKKRGDRVEWTKEMRDKLSKKYSGDGNPMYGKPGYWTGKKRPDISGEKSGAWKGGCYISKEGYKIHIVNGKDIPEHRFIMENKLGRKLTEKEIVHHIDKNHLNNSEDNLMIVTRSEHIALHRDDLLAAKKLGLVK